MTKIIKAQKVAFLFFIYTLVGFTFSFFLHLFIVQKNQFIFLDKGILLAYLLNFFLAASIFLTLYFLRKNHKNKLGFLFLFGSLLKFAVFFIVFLPNYQPGFAISKSAVIAFFVPYLIGLITETWAVVVLLNLPESPNK